MASTDANPQPKKNVAYRVYFPILNNTGSLVTGAAGLDSERSLDGATFADCTNEATEIATASGIYYLDLTAAEMNADAVAVIVKTTTTDAKTTTLIFYPAEDSDVHVDVQMWKGTAVATPGTAGTPSVDITRIANAAVSASTAQLGVNLVNIAGSAVNTATAQLGVNTVNFGGSAGTFAAGRPEVNTTHAAGTAWNSGGIGAATLAADTLTAAKVAADVSTEFATTFFGTAIPGAFGAGTAGSRLGKLPDVAAGSSTGLFIAGTNAATTVTTSLTTTFTGNLTGNVGGSVASVTGLTASNLDATISSRLATAGYTTPPTSSANADAVWDEATSGHIVDGSYGQRFLIARSGTCQAAANVWQIVLDTGASAVDDTYNGCVALISDGTCAGQARVIYDYAGSSKIGSIFNGWVGGPLDATSKFVLLPTDATNFGLTTGAIADSVWGWPLPGAHGSGTAGNILGNRIDDTITSRASQASVTTVDDMLDTELPAISTAVLTTIPGTITALQADTDNIQTRIPAALVSGRMDSSVGEMQANTITAAAVATDALDADALAASAVNEIAAAVGALAGADPTSVPSATASLAAKIDWLCALARNDRTINRITGVIALRNDTDSGTISTYTVSDDGTTTTIPEAT